MEQNPNQFLFPGPKSLIWTLYLMPLAFYLVFLGQNHQQGRIRVLSGRSDLLRLWCCLSGLLILGGPRLLAMLHHQLTLNSIAQGGQEPLYLLREVWVALFGLYAIVVGLWGYALWKAREKLTLVYSGSATLVRQGLEILSLDSHINGQSESQAESPPGNTKVQPIIHEDPFLNVVEIHWPGNLLPWKENYEKLLEVELSHIHPKPTFFWIIPVALGLGILLWLASQNLSQAWQVLRQG